MSYRELDAFVAQCDDLDDLISGIADQEWERETRCPPLDVKQLVVHVAAVLPVWASFFDAEDPGEKTSDRIEWWGYDAAAQAPKIVDRAQRMAGDKDPASVVAMWRENKQKAIEVFSASKPDRLVSRGGVTLPAADLVCVGVVEVGIHTMDVGHALNQGERLVPAAQSLIVEVLEGLAGEPFPLKVGWDARTKILTSTGRRPLAPNERVSLGPFAAKIPLFT